MEEQDKKDFSEYNHEKYDYAVGMLKTDKEKKKLPKWAQTLLAWGVGLLMVAMWLFAYAWSLTL